MNKRPQHAPADHPALPRPRIGVLVANLGTPPAQRWKTLPPRPPVHDPNDIYGIISRDTRVPTDNREIIARLMDARLGAAA